MLDIWFYLVQFIVSQGLHISIKPVANFTNIHISKLYGMLLSRVDNARLLVFFKEI